MKTIQALIFGSLLIVISCTPKMAVIDEKSRSDSVYTKPSSSEYLELAVLWQQNAGEYKALCYQAYQIAKLRVDESISNDRHGRPLAIITDIDETVLDNSPYSAMQVLNDEGFSTDTWYEWGKRESAAAIHGALDFFSYADSMGIEVFYISNRSDIQLEETINNLKSLHFPNSDSTHILLKKETSKKGARRKLVTDHYEVLLYIGDNLSDFHSTFDDKTTEDRNREVVALKDAFGTQFIILPNPMYGDWESKGLYQGQRSLSQHEKSRLRKSSLKAY